MRNVHFESPSAATLPPPQQPHTQAPPARCMPHTRLACHTSHPGMPHESPWHATRVTLCATHIRSSGPGSPGLRLRPPWALCTDRRSCRVPARRRPRPSTQLQVVQPRGGKESRVEESRGHQEGRLCSPFSDTLPLGKEGQEGGSGWQPCMHMLCTDASSGELMPCGGY